VKVSEEAGGSFRVGAILFPYMSERKITSFGTGGGLATGGEWEANLSLDNDEYLIANGASKREAIENLIAKATAAGLGPQLEAYLRNYPGDIYAEDPVPMDFHAPLAPYCWRYHRDRDTDEEVVTIRIGSGEEVNARGTTHGEAEKNLLDKLREMGLAVDRMTEFESLRGAVASFEEMLRRWPGRRPLPPAFDYNRAFEDGVTFESRREHVSARVTIHVVEAGTLEAPSGWVVVRDPGILPDLYKDETPLNMQIPAGRYPVLLSMAAFGSDALPTAAMVRIGTKLVVRWETGDLRWG